jgi:latrophilin 3
MAALLNYFFLAVFCWMLCESVMLYLLLVVVFSKLSKRWWFFLLLGWGK